MEKVNIKEKIDFVKKSIIATRDDNLRIISLGEDTRIINDMKAKYLKGVNNELHDALESILNDFDDMAKQAQNEAYQ